MNTLTQLRYYSLAGLATILVACQTAPPIDADKSASTATPDSVTEQSAGNQEFVWGGKILQTQNQQGSTEITILSYPLDKNQKPRLRRDSSGRFIAIYPGYLEPIDYAAGKAITVVGKLTGFRNGAVADADYAFPLLSVDNIQLHKAQDRMRIPFSIGVGIGL